MLSLRFVLRNLLRRPVLVLTAVATIALGVAANSVVFSLIQAVLLRPLPFRAPSRLMYLWQTHPSLGNLPVTYPDYLDWKQARSFEAVEAYTFQAMNKVALLGQGAPEQLQASMVSHGLFPMLGIGFVQGRGFTAQDEASKQNVVLISETLWRRKFAADPNLVGRTIRIHPLALTVIGIVKQKQAFPVWADLWLPMSMLEPGLVETRRFHPMEILGRLRDGATIAQAQAEIAAIAGRNATAHPVTNRNMGGYVVPLLVSMTGPVRPALLIVWMAVGLLLLMACANVAHLLLTRTIARRRELAIRASLGASSLDLAKLLGLESVLLVAAGGLAGGVAAGALLPLVRTLAGSRIPRAEGIGFDAPVFLYTILAAVLTTVMIALPSFLQILRADLYGAVRQGDESAPVRRRLGPALMLSEIALSFVVLASALLLARSFSTLLAVNPGFDGRNVLALDVTLATGPDGWPDAAKLFENRIRPAIRALAGVEAVASANMAPMSLDRTETSRFASRFGIAGIQHAEGAFPVAQLRWVTADYFRILKIPLLRGRWISSPDHDKRWLINQTLARQFFPAQDSVGRELITGVGTPEPSRITIAGVVGDVRDLSLDTPPQPTAYMIDTSPGMTLLVRTSGDPRSLAPAIREILHQAQPDAPVTRVRTVAQLVSASLARSRFALQLMAAFAAVAALLSVIGIYGVVAYSVGRRSKEFGVRAAVGATPADLLRQVLAEGMRASITGLAAGLALFTLVSRLFRTVLYEVSSLDAVALTASAALVVLISLLAVAIPARRASTLDPNIALRDA